MPQHFKALFDELNIAAISISKKRAERSKKVGALVQKLRNEGGAIKVPSIMHYNAMGGITVKGRYINDFANILGVTAAFGSVYKAIDHPTEEAFSSFVIDDIDPFEIRPKMRWRRYNIMLDVVKKLLSQDVKVIFMDMSLMITKGSLPQTDDVEVQKDFDEQMAMIENGVNALLHENKRLTLCTAEDSLNSKIFHFLADGYGMGDISPKLMDISEIIKTDYRLSQSVVLKMLLYPGERTPWYEINEDNIEGPIYPKSLSRDGLACCYLRGPERIYRLEIPIALKNTDKDKMAETAMWCLSHSPSNGLLPIFIAETHVVSLDHILQVAESLIDRTMELYK